MSSQGRDSAASAWIFLSSMIYTGIDYHKRYSEACTLDAEGRKLKEARFEANAPEAFKDYFASLGEASEVIIEGCWNWATLLAQGELEGMADELLGLGDDEGDGTSEFETREEGLTVDDAVARDRTQPVSPCSPRPPPC